MLMFETEYFKYMDENKFTNPYIQRNLKHFLINETFRVGFSTYVKPPTNPFSDGFKYSIYPKKMKFFNDCVRNITNPKRNSYFRINPTKKSFYELRGDYNDFSNLTLEELIPYLKKDIELRKRFNSKFSEIENIRGIFHILFNPYPKGYFDKIENLEYIPIHSLDLVS